MRCYEPSAARVLLTRMKRGCRLYALLPLSATPDYDAARRHATRRLRR